MTSITGGCFAMLSHFVSPRGTSKSQHADHLVQQQHAHNRARQHPGDQLCDIDAIPPARPLCPERFNHLAILRHAHQPRSSSARPLLATHASTNGRQEGGTDRQA